MSIQAPDQPVPAAPPLPAAPPPAAADPGAARPTLDPGTLAELYRLHGGYLLRALQRVTNGDRGKAEDILQETLLRAWQHPEAIAAGPEQSRPWLFTVARRIAIDHYRMAAARAQEVSGDMLEDRPPVADPYAEAVALRDIERVLERLQPHHREVLVELHLKDRSVQEAAERLGVPSGTVKSRNFYAIRALRPLLAAEPGYAPVEPSAPAVPAGAGPAPTALPGAA
ncbi:hypothetical protein GCM10010495_39910 [Kitasatospora herbaricolor]|uniref:sigma-70 family RNA polymerase sigma factor n=1 Tax=Kitasatospora herbaricolor TaxID=68217 RepID=UPI0019C1985C|nr:sigma-70 family RNA polymerase sigma factor [Kitasatospora herbaricolor]MDQ0313187.1 RNA polymerase sigma-70 factor (ECF subfamily) [Kitasatospora herbaricolor]GGV20617.1 hypothetical protein GCM10010495_39910 [Kitasatospora herbaricolor]